VTGLLNGAEVCRVLRMDRHELRQRSRAQGGYPRDPLLVECFKPGCSRPYWDAESIEAWKHARLTTRRAKAGAS
jgi:hypothetical protein